MNARRSNEEWGHIIADCQTVLKSGGSVSAYAKAHRIPLNTLYGRFSRANISMPRKSKELSPDIEKNLREFIPFKAQNGDVRIELKTGEIITVKSADDLRTVIKALRE